MLGYVEVGDLHGQRGVLRAIGAAGPQLCREALDPARWREAPLQNGLLHGGGGGGESRFPSVPRGRQAGRLLLQHWGVGRAGRAPSALCSPWPWWRSPGSQPPPSQAQPQPLLLNPLELQGGPWSNPGRLSAPQRAGRGWPTPPPTARVVERGGLGLAGWLGPLWCRPVPGALQASQEWEARLDWRGQEEDCDEQRLAKGLGRGACSLPRPVSGRVEGGRHTCPGQELGHNQAPCASSASCLATDILFWPRPLAPHGHCCEPAPRGPPPAGPLRAAQPGTSCQSPHGLDCLERSGPPAGWLLPTATRPLQACAEAPKAAKSLLGEPLRPRGMCPRNLSAPLEPPWDQPGQEVPSRELQGQRR